MLKRIRTKREIDLGMKFLLDADPRLAQIAAKASEIPLRLEAPGFEGLTRIIIAQQVSRASAQAITSRFLELVSPTSPERFLQVGEDVWRQIGLSRPKQKTLYELSTTVVDGRLDLDEICEIKAIDALAKLTSVHGIGPWTAEVYLLFCAGHQDIFPAGDLALQIAVEDGLKLNNRPDDKQLRKIAETWSPWRGVAARLFWAYYANLKQGKSALPV